MGEVEQKLAIDMRNITKTFGGEQQGEPTGEIRRGIIAVR